MLKPAGPKIDTRDKSVDADGRANMVKLVKVVKPTGPENGKMLKPAMPNTDKNDR